MSRDWKDEVQATSRAQVARSIPEGILSTGKYRVSAAWGRRPHRAQDRRICMHDLLFRAGRATPRQWIPRPVSHRDAPERSRCLATGPVSRAVPFTGRVSLTQGPVLLVANQGATLTPQVVIESLGHTARRPSPRAKPSDTRASASSPSWRCHRNPSCTPASRTQAPPSSEVTKRSAPV